MTPSTNRDAVSSSPYDSIADERRWSSVARDVACGRYDAQGDVRFTVEPHMRIASAGSCFAGRMAEALRTGDTQYFVAEPAPPWVAPEREAALGYRPFSARYGLVFTASQLLQLFTRAFGTFVPRETAWEFGGRYVDPFRPRATPGGFASVAELLADRDRHLAAVRKMFEETDVLLVTLGLSEYWCDRVDGAIFPFCPGVAGGTFDGSRHEFRNPGLGETVASLEAFVAATRAINPEIKIILSVSPVPIGATMENMHVARASTYTKSLLRVAVEEVVRAHDYVDYFAAYEIVSQTFLGRDPFVEDRRHLRAGIAESVVALFRSHYMPQSTAATKDAPESIVLSEERPCDEDILAR